MKWRHSFPMTSLVNPYDAFQEQAGYVQHYETSRMPTADAVPAVGRACTPGHVKKKPAMNVIRDV
ncbi:hypothetical protein TSMEX_002172 [Taenia solium]|eukprot:TsM_000557600 transcript=TsM_000557600 gene=TsM_000557600